MKVKVWRVPGLGHVESCEDVEAAVEVDVEVDFTEHGEFNGEWWPKGWEGSLSADEVEKFAVLNWEIETRGPVEEDPAPIWETWRGIPGGRRT